MHRASDDGQGRAALGAHFRRWRSRHPTAFDLLVALLLAASIEYLLVPYFLHDTRYVRHLGDRIADAMIRLAESIRGAPASAVPFVFVDIDTQTWRDWNAPLVVPRDKLSRMLSVAANSKPLLIILDVNLAWSEPGMSEDGALSQFFGDYPFSGPPLILLRSAIRGYGSGTNYPYPRATPFDRIIQQRLAETPAPPIRWATAYFDVDGDNVVRRWRLAEAFCDKSAGTSGTGVPIVLPSVYLTAAAVAAHPNEAGRAAEELDTALRQLVPDRCDAPPKAPVHVHGMQRPIIVGADERGNRIIYSIRWDEDRFALGPFARFGRELVPLVSVRPARMILTAPPSTAIDGLEGRIVIMGGSFPDSGDLHRTPLGTMPGALLIANATHALLVSGTPEEPRPLPRFALSFGLVVVNALLFHFLRVEIASLAAATLILLLMIATVPLFASGVALDLEVPSTGVLLHRYLAYLERSFRNMRHGGRRSLLRSHQAAGPRNGDGDRCSGKS